MAKKSTPKKKAATRKSMAMTKAGNSGGLQSLIAVLKDKEKPIKDRYAALQELGAAQFASPDFPSVKGDYVAALREASSDADGELRQRTLGILAREKDGYAMK